VIKLVDENSDVNKALLKLLSSKQSQLAGLGYLFKFDFVVRKPNVKYPFMKLDNAQFQLDEILDKLEEVVAEKSVPVATAQPQPKQYVATEEEQAEDMNKEDVTSKMEEYNKMRQVYANAPKVIPPAPCDNDGDQDDQILNAHYLNNQPTSMGNF